MSLCENNRENAVPAAAAKQEYFVQPNVEPDANKPGRMTNSIKQFQNFLKEVQHFKYAAIFLDPVDTVKNDAPNYYNVIKNPMDINTIMQRVKNNYYCSIKEALSDFQLIYKNCFQYYKVGDKAFKCGLKLKQAFQSHIVELPQLEVELSTKGTDQKQENKLPLIEELPQHISKLYGILNVLKVHCTNSVRHFALYYEFSQHKDCDEPMDFTVVEAKLFYQLYDSLTEFVYDIRLIYVNALQTSKPTDGTFESAGFVANTFENILLFFERLGRLPNEQELPLINTLWKMPIYQKKVINCAIREIDPLFYAPENKRHDNIKKELEDIANREMETKPFREEFLKAVHASDDEFNFHP